MIVQNCPGITPLDIERMTISEIYTFLAPEKKDVFRLPSDIIEEETRYNAMTPAEKLKYLSTLHT